MHRRQRLVQNRQFQRAYEEGLSFVHPLLVLRAVCNGLPYNRFGFVVGGRIGKAVVRNQVKRRLREAMRLRAAQVAPGWDLVLVARMPVVRASYWHIEEALDNLLRRLQHRITASELHAGGGLG